MSAKKTILRRSERIFSHIDVFGETVGFDIGGAGSVKSIFGALLTLITFCIVFIYGSNKFMVMINREGSDFQTVVHSRDLNSSIYFEQNQTNIEIAVGLFQLNLTRTISLEDLKPYFEW